MTAENELLRALVRQIRRGDRAGLERAGRVIAQSMNDTHRTPWFRSKLEELAEIWLRGFEACAQELDPITCRQLPAMLRAINPDWRRGPWGPSLSHIGRELNKAPMTDEEVNAFLDQLATEDGFREWCVYGRLACQNGLPVEALISLEGVEIPGGPIARMYRCEELVRWWHPGEAHPERSMMADLLILFASQHGGVNGAILPRLTARMLPYIRSFGRDELLVQAVDLGRDLALCGVLKGGFNGHWMLTAARGTSAAAKIASTWIETARAQSAGE